MNKEFKTYATWMLLGAMLLIVSGCVYPGDMDQRVVGRYQRAMEQRGPQQRGEGLDFLKPAQVVKPELKTQLDEETGKTRVMISLEEAIIRTLSNNMDIRVQSYEPAISREEMVLAASEFDYTVYGQFRYLNNDRLQNRSVSTQDVLNNPIPLRQFSDAQSTNRVWTAGIREKMITGGTWDMAWNLTRTYDSSTARSINRDYENTATLSLTQPLLRDAWPEYNLGNLRVARLNYNISEARFREQVEQTVREVTVAYWQLIQARRNWAIVKELLDRTIETRDRIEKRRSVDATEVEYKQAQASVETRRAVLILAGKSILDAQDRLVRLLEDGQLNLLGDYEILPVTRLSTEAVQLDEADQLLTALRHNPQLEQIRLAISVYAIQVTMAKNQTLPRLDLAASAELQGMAKVASDAMEKVNDGDYASYTFGMYFEYPIGNRGRLAALRQAQLRKTQTVAALQRTADDVAQLVRERIRQVRTALEEIDAQHKAVQASRDQLEALNAVEELRSLSPEFLNVKLQAQASLASSQSAELQAIVSYNSALADLAQATGTILEMHRVKVPMQNLLGEATYPESEKNARD